MRGLEKRTITVVSAPESMDIATKVFIAANILALLLFVGLGAALVLLRPSIATWAFYLFCLALNPASNSVAPGLLVFPWNWVAMLLALYVIWAGVVGVAVFGALFLHEPPVGWRASVCRLAPLMWLVLVGLQTYSTLGQGWFGWPVRAVENIVLALGSITVIVALYALISTYSSVRGADRQRIRWVVLGFGIALTTWLTGVISSSYLSGLPFWFYGSLGLASVTVPLAVGYAVIKHRVIDVSFVVSRTIVYAVLTTLLVGVFSLIDWFFTDYLRVARLGTFVEVAAVVAFGLWFNGLHKRVDTLIDATFFRQRHRAEVQLARNAAALPLATTARSVAQALVEEPTRALSLASAALFRRANDGSLTREESRGWSETDLMKLDQNDDHFLILVQAENGPLSLDDHPWRTEGVPTGPARPALALPILVRRELTAIVFYGSHVHGEALDPDEIKAIAGLATGAAAAYDHLEAEAMKQKVDALEKEIESLRGAIAEAQIQPA